ncbi:ead/Ea22-like family protein [Enterobacter bugandensis]
MSNIDKLMEKLKSAALKLNCEQWQTRNGFSGVEVIVKGSVAKGHGCVSYQPVASELVDTKTAKAIALFCPANILALLDELEAKDKRLNEILAPNMLLPAIDDMDEDNLRHVIKTVCENYSLLHAKWEAAENRAEAAEKRTAELEARTLVPVEPTLDQLVAGKRRLTSTGRMSRLMSQRLAEVYRAMVSAAAAGKGE